MTPAPDSSSPLPVVIIGAGPVGLAAAAHLLARGQTPVIFEADERVGANLLKWGHVRVFTPWRYLVDRAAGDLLAAAGWTHPDPDAYPTGAEIVAAYLRPLAATPALRQQIHTGVRVIGVARQGLDKLKTAGREVAPFVVTTQDAAGDERRTLARAVIDASGTYTTPNPLGADGTPALGERRAGDRIAYGIPDVLGAERARYAGRHVLVVGSGHSAFNAILDLIALAGAEPETRITWAVRRASVGQMFGGGESDALSARGALGAAARAAVERGALRFVTQFRASEVRSSGEHLDVIGQDGAIIDGLDEIIVAAGFRPDLSALSELRLDLDAAVESPSALAPLIDPNVHSCGTVRPHGVDVLSHPERDFYIIGMKSYGRAPTFLMLTGYEQARSVAAAIAGDWESARRVQLELPETGVCTSDALDGGSACCGTSAEAAPALLALADIPVSGGLIALQPVQAFQPIQMLDLAPARACGCADSCCAEPVAIAPATAERDCGCADDCCR